MTTFNYWLPVVRGVQEIKKTSNKLY